MFIHDSNTISLLIFWKTVCESQIKEFHHGIHLLLMIMLEIGREIYCVYKSFLWISFTIRVALAITVSVGDCGGNSGNDEASIRWILNRPFGRPR